MSKRNLEDLKNTFTTLWLQERHFSDLCDLRRLIASNPLRRSEKVDGQPSNQTIVGVVMIYASWNRKRPFNGLYANEQALLTHLSQELTYGLKNCQTFCASIQVDRDDESLSICLADNDAQQTGKTSQTPFPIPPTEFPALALVLQQSHMEHSVLRYIKTIRPNKLVSSLQAAPKTDDAPWKNSAVFRACQSIMFQLESEFHLAVTPESCNTAIRIFIAGDKSSVGKSSVCLGLLGNLLQSGRFAEDELAYIKPATQSESTQLIQLYCNQHQVDGCVPIGPLVYYRGFTRAFLAGLTEGSDELLIQCGRAVDRLARKKKVVLVDGVGFPGVGSICGTDNPRVARACGYPISKEHSHNDDTDYEPERAPMGVVLVGGSGVGAAVDAFNLNATYFEKYHVPVMGAIFNKLSETGYYSLENCKKEVTAYFQTYDEQGRRPFGFVPLYPDLGSSTTSDGSALVMGHVDTFLSIFGNHVDIAAILDAARKVREEAMSSVLNSATSASNSQRDRTTSFKKAPASNHVKRRKIMSALARGEIEKAAISAGAAPSA